MSPLFGKRHDDDAGAGFVVEQAGSVSSGGAGDAGQSDPKHLPRLVQLGAALDDAVKDAAAMPLPALAAKLLNELFGSDYQPRGNGVDVDSIASR